MFVYKLCLWFILLDLLFLHFIYLGDMSVSLLRNFIFSQTRIGQKISKGLLVSDVGGRWGTERTGEWEGSRARENETELRVNKNITVSKQLLFEVWLQLFWVQTPPLIWLNEPLISPFSYEVRLAFFLNYLFLKGLRKTLLIHLLIHSYNN